MIVGTRDPSAASNRPALSPKDPSAASNRLGRKGRRGLWPSIGFIRAKRALIADRHALPPAVGAADQPCRGHDDGLDAGVLIDDADLVPLGLQGGDPGFGRRAFLE